MNSYLTSPAGDFLQQPRVRVGLLAATILMFVIAAVLVGLTLWGYGTARFAGLPSDVNVYINGHKVIPHTIRLRPGTYQLVLTSPTINPYESTLQVGLFQQTVVPKPIVEERDINAIASSLVGAIPGTSIPPNLANTKRFENNTWVVGTLAPTPSLLVMRYNVTQKQWAVVFSNNFGYPSNLSGLPSAVTAYIRAWLMVLQRGA